MSGVAHGEKLHALIAAFDRPGPLVEAARRARDAGYRQLDALTPFPVEGLPQALGLPRSTIPLIGLIAGLLGGGGIYLLMWWTATVDYPWNIGGRPLHSWPAFIPITFEVTILAASIAMTLGVLVLCRLPRPHHPLFESAQACRAVRDRFVLVIEVGDGQFDAQRTRAFLESLDPLSVGEVWA